MRYFDRVYGLFSRTIKTGIIRGGFRPALTFPTFRAEMAGNFNRDRFTDLAIRVPADRRGKIQQELME